MRNQETYCCIECNNMARWEWDLLYGPNDVEVQDTPPPLDPIDALMRKYAGEIDKMYDNRTRGDYSSLGIIAAFSAELSRLEAKS